MNSKYLPPAVTVALFCAMGLYGSIAYTGFSPRRCS